jgi:6-phosphogluconolactonase (cycloisomerase 2 family)
VFFAACSAGGDGGDNPPPTGYKYYAYVANGSSDNISGYSINTATGAWTGIAGSPFMAGARPVQVGVDPTGKFAYVVNQGSANISAYAINAATGALTEIPGSPFPTGSQPWRVSVDRTGRYLFVGLSFHQVSAYAIAASTGALTEIAGSPYSQGTTGGNSDLKVDPHGYFLLYVANTGQGVYGYTIDFDTGALNMVQGSPFQPPSSADYFACLALDPQSRFLYVAYDVASSNAQISLFQIEWATGNLVPSGVFSSGAVSPRAMAVDPAGKFLYLTDSANDQVFAFAIDAATGGLAGLANSPFTAGDGPTSIALEPAGRFAYVANAGSSNVSAYSMNPTTGVLTPIIGSPIPIVGGTSPRSIDIIKITQ